MQRTRVWHKILGMSRNVSDERDREETEYLETLRGTGRMTVRKPAVEPGRTVAGPIGRETCC